MASNDAGMRNLACGKDGFNIGNPPREVYHAELEPADDGLYKSMCPVCGEGILLVMRGQSNLELLDTDRCILCGQTYIYQDIEEMKKPGYKRKKFTMYESQVKRSQIISFLKKYNRTTNITGITGVMLSIRGQDFGPVISVKLDAVFRSEVAPSTPNVGDTWVKTGETFVWIGDTWAKTSGKITTSTTGDGQPPQPQTPSSLRKLGELGDRKLTLDDQETKKPD